ncbi:MAG: hypothetical protein ACRD4E_09200, partial [Bryobacteraceae bacterium]
LDCAGSVRLYAEHRRHKGLEVSSVNRELEVLRRMLRLATEWGQTDRTLAKVRALKGENHRERVLSPNEERKYLKVAPSLLRDVTTIYSTAAFGPRNYFDRNGRVFETARDCS